MYHDTVGLLSEVSIFSETPKLVLDELARALKVMHFDAHQPVIVKGEEGDCMYIIKSGKVRVHDGEHLIAEIAENKIFGELSLLNPEPRSASVTTLVPSVLLRLDRSDFYTIIATRSEVLKGMIRLLISRIRKQNNSIIENLKQRERELEELVALRTAELVAEKHNLEIAYSEINRQKEELHEKNENIKSSINYAQRIQGAMLPETQQILESLPNSFVLFKPRDVVSGDAFWFAKKNNLIIFAAIDCTGHGIPGALMSMIGNMLLNTIVHQAGIIQPAEILSHLHRGVRQALKQDDLESKSRDGMDVAIITYLPQAKKLLFAGAHRPLWYIENNEIVEIRGTRAAIGGVQNEGDRSFEQHEIDTRNLDTFFYMFTDGYPDQFGGPDNRKFMIKSLKNLLLEINTKQADEQHLILDQTIENWKNGKNQTDDILVIGFKLP